MRVLWNIGICIFLFTFVGRKGSENLFLKINKIKLYITSRSRQGLFKSNFLVPCFFYDSEGSPMTITPLTTSFSDQWDLAAAKGLVHLIVNLQTK